MRAIEQRIIELGGQLTLIGTGTPEQGRDFTERTQAPFRLLTDAKLVGYQALQLKRKIYGGFRRQTILRFWRAWRQGSRGAGILGDPHQLGGVLVIRPDNKIAYAYLSETLDDRNDPWEIVRSLEATA